MGTTGAVLGLEAARAWRRDAVPPTPARALAVAREGYRATPAHENAVFNMFVAFGATFGLARAVTHQIRAGSPWLGNVVVGRRHIHHFVPGIVLALLAGGVSVGLRNEEIERWLAVPFGAGAALVLDESALLLELDDVYWSEEGIVSVHIALGTVALLGSLVLTARLLRRGEASLAAGQDALASGSGPQWSDVSRAPSVDS